MIAITKKGISLVMPLTCLQDLLFLQMGIISAMQKEASSTAHIDGSAVISPLAELLQATLFNEEQMDEIEAHFQGKVNRQKMAA